MKKLHLWVALGFISIAGIVYAGNQLNWGTSLGSGWITPDDTSVTVGAPVQIGQTNTPYVRAGGAPLTLFAASSTTIAALTPGTTGQILIESSGLTANSLCISTGINAGAWVLAASTGSVCK